MTATARTPARRLSPAQRQATILDAARAAFADASYADVGVPAIARAAGASPALVFHYYGSKAGMYEAVVADALAELAEAQASADAGLPPNTPARDRVRTWVLAHLDHVAARPRAWASGWTGAEEPAGALERRALARAGAVEFLSGVLRPEGGRRHRFAVLGFLGFLDRCCLAWVEHGCPEDERWPLVEASLGALEGALGDWGG